jgi:hypothetical protein
MQTHSRNYKSEDIFNTGKKKINKQKYHKFKAVKNVEIYKTMTLQKTHLRRMNYITKDVNHDLINKETYEPNVKKVKPRIVSDPYGIPELEYYKENKKFQKNVSVFKDFILDGQVTPLFFILLILIRKFLTKF